MKKKRIPVIISLVFMLCSCATLGIVSEARREFDQGMALFNRGQYEEALSRFQRATEADPDFAEAYLYLGRSCLNTGQWLEAIDPLRTALRLSPEKTRKEVLSILVDALLGAAASELQKGRFDTSIAFLKEVLTLQPQSEKARNELFRALLTHGETLLSRKRPAEALSAFTEAVRIDPGSSSAYLGLARAFLPNGDIRGAFQSVKDALRIDPTNEQALLLIKELMR
ncbi:MAG: tetratricopeptide repeat protein [Deltaproteobacteria bacterium]|nr:tetratricopeptide repeat protein [Deltaproteobacteria bacterium]